MRRDDSHYMRVMFLWAIPWILIGFYFNIGYAAFACVCNGVFGGPILAVYLSIRDEDHEKRKYEESFARLDRVNDQ